MLAAAAIALCLSAAAAAPAVDLSAPVNDAALITSINSARAGWTAAASPKFFNMSLAEAKRLMGARRDPARRAALPRSALALPAAIPANFNATAAWPACAGVIGHIRDQSDCGCCWAFASTESFNDRLCIATNASQTELLSPQDTCSCCNGAHGCGSDGGCNGGFTEDAFNYFRKFGVVSGGDEPSIGSGSSCFPYQLKPCGHHEASPLTPCPQICSPGECQTPKCPSTCSEAGYGVAFSADKRKARGGAVRCDSVAAAQAEILAHGSIAASFTVYADFLTYESGVYKHVSGASLGGHAVKVIGWGTTADGVDYWLINNSWNVYWGLNGAFMIERGTNECGIEDDLVAGLA